MARAKRFKFEVDTWSGTHTTIIKTPSIRKAVEILHKIFPRRFDERMIEVRS